MLISALRWLPAATPKDCQPQLTCRLLARLFATSTNKCATQGSRARQPSQPTTNTGTTLDRPHQTKHAALISHHDKQLDIKPPDPVRQILIKRIPVEYHGPIDNIHKFTDDTLWLPIYRFPYNHLFTLVIRIKIYLTLISLGFCSQRLYLLLTSQPNISLSSAAILSSLSLGGLIYAGNLFKRIICQVYASEDGEYVRFSRLTFFGRRMDLVMPVESVTPLTELNDNATKLFTKCRFIKPDSLDQSFDTQEFYDEEFLIPLRFGGVLDLDNFERIMGRILTAKYKPI